MNYQKNRRLGPYLWRMIYPYLAYIGLINFFTLLATFLSIAAAANGFTMISTAEDYVSLVAAAESLVEEYAYEIQAVAALVMIPILWLFYRSDVKRKEAEGLREARYEKAAPVQYLLAAAAAITAAFAANNALYLTGLMESSQAYQTAAESYFQGHFALELLCLGVIIPITEEGIFRGLMYSRLKEYMPRNTAALMCALCFALVHGNIVQGTYSFALSLLMIYLVEKYHDLRAPILFHMTSNILSVIQQETALLDPLYATTGRIVVVMILMMILLIAVIYSISRNIDLKEI